jgi:zinc-ribbon domain
MSGPTSDKVIGEKPGAGAPSSADKSANTTPTLVEKSAQALRTSGQAGVRVPPKADAASNPAASSSPTTNRATKPGAATSLDPTPANATAQRTLKCPKCGSDVREVARFCQRCHHTMRYECPSCHHEQRTGGKCEKCGIDFLKYIAAVMSQKQVESEAMRERLEKRSTLMKNLMWLPFTLGFPIIRDYFLKRDRKK